MEKVRTFRDLKVWQRAHELVLAVYAVTKQFPDDERYGITSQIRRSVSSIATNIVEGCKRNGKKEFLYFLNISDTSVEETKYHLLLSRDLGYLANSEYERLLDLCNQVGRMLNALQKSLEE